MQQTLVGFAFKIHWKEYWTYDEGEAVKVVNFHENQTNAVMHNEFFLNFSYEQYLLLC